MTLEDFETMTRLVKIADAKFDGHLSVLKFTTNWRVGFVTPEGREAIEEMHVGETFDDAATKALLSVRGS
jgi:hypothetical protein